MGYKTSKVLLSIHDFWSIFIFQKGSWSCAKQKPQRTASPWFRSFTSTDLSLCVAGGCSDTLLGSRRPAQTLGSAQRTECDCARGSAAPSPHSWLHGRLCPLLYVCNASLYKETERITTVLLFYIKHISGEEPSRWVNSMKSIHFALQKNSHTNNIKKWASTWPFIIFSAQTPFLI